VAFLINYSDPKTGCSISDAYLKITKVQVCKADKVAYLNVAVYASQAAREANLQPVATQQYACNDWVGLATKDAPGIKHSLYSGFFGTLQLADPVNSAPATNIDDILISQAYMALKAHPTAVALLAGATVAENAVPAAG
jgi:hypothetical protein